MKIYIVVRYEYGDEYSCSHIEGIFSTLERAEAFQKLHSGENFQIEEYGMDTCNPGQLRYYAVYFNLVNDALVISDYNDLSECTDNWENNIMAFPDGSASVRITASDDESVTVEDIYEMAVHYLAKNLPLI